MNLPGWTPGVALFVAGLAVALLLGGLLARLETWTPPERERRKRQLRALRSVENLEPGPHVWPDTTPDGRRWP